MKHIKLIVAFIFQIYCSSINGQSIRVDTIIFTETVDKEYISHIPYVVDLSGTNKTCVSKINETIKERFMIESFDPEKVREFRWYELSFTHEIKSSILLISFAGEYYGAYPNPVAEDLYFDLKTGNQLKEKILPYQAFFSLVGYHSFLSKYWMANCMKEYKNATQCAEGEPYCNCYDIEISFDQQRATFTLTFDCFPHVSRACTPMHQLTIHRDSIQKYLSPFGEEVIYKSNYSQMSRLEKFLFYKINEHLIPNYYFIAGSINNKYPFSMAIELNENIQTATGFYYYEKHQEPIKLTGEFTRNQIVLREHIDSKINGIFNFRWYTSYEENGTFVGNNSYWGGKWTNAITSKEMVIGFTSVKMNKFPTWMD